MKVKDFIAENFRIENKEKGKIYYLTEPEDFIRILRTVIKSKLPIEVHFDNRGSSITYNKYNFDFFIGTVHFDAFARHIINSKDDLRSKFINSPYTKISEFLDFLEELKQKEVDFLEMEVIE